MAFGRSQEDEENEEERKSRSYEDTKMKILQKEELQKSHEENGLYDDNGNQIA